MNNTTFDFDWHLTDACNFECSYCHPNVATHKNRATPHDLSALDLAARFNDLPGSCHISMSGGEPMMLSNFADFCLAIASAGNELSMNTNLSLPDVVADFVAKVPSESVRRINAALHIEERLRQGLNVEQFARLVGVLQNAGHNVVVFYVLHPTVLDRFMDDYTMMQQAGVRAIAGKPFKGFWEGRRYPMGYTEAERKVLETIEGDAYERRADYLDGMARRMHGRLCAAGVRHFKVEVDGEVRRCASTAERLGNLYDGTFRPIAANQPCTARYALALSICKDFVEGWPESVSTGSPDPIAHVDAPRISPVLRSVSPATE